MALAESGLIDVYYQPLNAISKERIDPIFSFVFSVLELGKASVAYSCLQYLFFFLGVYAFAKVLQIAHVKALCIAAFVLVALLFILGGDPFYFRLQWFPLFIASVAALRLRKQIAFAIPAVLFGVLWVLSGGTYALLGVLVAFLYVFMLAKVQLRVSARWELAMAREWRAHVATFALFCLLLPLSIVFLPVYSMPDYPSSARLSPISALTFLSQPLLGPGLQPNTLLYDSFLELNSFRLLRFITVGIAVLLLWRPNALRPAPIFIGVSMLLPFTLYPQLGALQAYLPFELLRMLVCGVALLPLPWLASSLFLVPSLTQITANASCYRISFCSFVLLLIAFTLQQLSIFELYDTSERHFERHFRRTAEASPSNFVVRTFGEWSSSAVQRERKLQLVDVEVSASANEDAAQAMIDGDKGTRWSTKRPQSQGDWIEFSFARPQLLSRISLSTGASLSDFPRGVRVEAEGVDGVSKTYLEIADWQGPIKWSKLGYPYFGPQTEVVLDLPAQILANSVRITQTSSHDKFDWSVYEVGFYSE